MQNILYVFEARKRQHRRRKIDKIYKGRIQRGRNFNGQNKCVVEGEEKVNNQFSTSLIIKETS
jgi:hypothetical protein